MKNKFVIMIFLIFVIVIGGIYYYLVEIKDDGTEKIVIGRMNDSRSLDPAITEDSESFQVTSNIYETLVTYDSSGSDVMPGLAESWKVSEDGLTWHFKIRKNIEFHDGSKLDAHVVAFNFKRWMDPSSPYHTGEFIYYNYSFGGFPGIIKSVNALSDTTVEIILTEPYAPFLNIISMPSFGIASQTAIVKYNDALKTHPVGTGPFIFESWVPNETIKLVRNKAYWNGEANAEMIEFVVLSDNDDKIELLKSGSVHIIDQLNVSEIDSVNADDALKLYYRPFFNIGYLALNNKTEPFNDINVRKAISLLIDKNDLLDDKYNDLVRTAHSFLPPTIEGYHEGLKSEQVDVVTAKKLLSKAGYTDGLKITLWVMDRPRNYFPNPMAIATSIKDQLAKADITLTINVIPWDNYIDDVKLGNHQMALVGWNGDIIDPDNFLYPLFASKFIKPELNFNYSLYENENVERLLMQARRTTDNGFRTSIYREMQEIIADDVASIPLIHTMTAIGTNTKIKNFKPHVSGFGVLIDLDIDK